MRKIRLAVLAAFVVPIAAYSQGGPPPDGPPPTGGPPHHMFGRGPDAFRHSWKIVTGAPYSATATDHFLQTLEGGNTIERSTTSEVARDSQGRTYTKEIIPGGPWASEAGSKTVVFITDPVAGYSYVLHPDKKMATRRPLKTPPERDQAGEEHSRLRKADHAKAHGNDVTETDLGSKEIAGVGVAQGRSITRTIPAGRIGNAQPIVSTSEVWYSPELQTVVLSKHNDPRMGQSTYTLSNIQRGEPNPALFQVPSDYKIEDAPARHGRPDGPE
ncbi:MAG: hypothetical protein JOY62_01955 [Acidobacteriaceae bacterium]|nr:hypothetical protein [Acidobacteriaceae bacterium]MBV9778712.1 hypothetical protein [Acidobacteriaceae bacterium]